jgi:hypothetical protein
MGVSSYLAKDRPSIKYFQSYSALGQVFMPLDLDLRVCKV